MTHSSEIDLSRTDETTGHERQDVTVYGMSQMEIGWDLD